MPKAARANACAAIRIWRDIEDDCRDEPPRLTRRRARATYPPVNTFERYPNSHHKAFRE